jgi:hypothetical protein
MNKNDELLTEIIRRPENYYPAQRKTLESRLEQISLSEEDQSDISSKTGKKLIRDKALGLFKITEVVSLVINWNETVEKEIKQAKKEHLISRYLEISDKHSEKISELVAFLSNPQGNILFNKILRIQDDSPPDLELANHLASALNHITNSEFMALFEAHKYALSLIEQLTPQEMSLLTTEAKWRPFAVTHTAMSGDRMTSPWIPQFVSTVLIDGANSHPDVLERIGHSLANLERAGIIKATMREGLVICVLTQIGAILPPYFKSY